MKIFFDEQGRSSTAADKCSWGLSTADAASTMIFTFPFTPIKIHHLQLVNPVKISKLPDADRFLDLANQAYASLSSGDQHEMEVWDSTLGDGRDDE